MSVRARIANWPLAWKVPLLAAGLLIGVAFVISQIVLNRLESDQENNLRHLTSAYLDGLSAAVLPISHSRATSGKLSTRSIARATVTPASRFASQSLRSRTGRCLRPRIHEIPGAERRPAGR